MNILEMLYRVDLNKNELFVCKIGKVKVKTEDKLDRESDVYKFMLKQNLSFQELVLCTLVCPFIREFHTELIKSNKIKILYKVKSRYYEPIHLVKKNKKYKDFSIFSQERIYSNGQEVIYEISNNTINEPVNEYRVPAGCLKYAVYGKEGTNLENQVFTKLSEYPFTGEFNVNALTVKPFVFTVASDNNDNFVYFSNETIGKECKWLNQHQNTNTYTWLMV